MNCCQPHRVEKVYSCSHNVEIRDICSKFQKTTLSLSALRSNLSVAEYTRILESLLSDSMEKMRPCPITEENEIYVKFCNSSDDSDEIRVAAESSSFIVGDEEIAYSIESLQYEEDDDVDEESNTSLLKSDSFIGKIAKIESEVVEKDQQNSHDLHIEEQRSKIGDEELSIHDEEFKSLTIGESMSSLLSRSSQCLTNFMNSRKLSNAALIVLALSIVAFYSINKFVH